MFFELTEEQQLVQDTARRFAEEDILPTQEEEEKNHEFRQDRVERMGELGFLSCVLPEELGGNGMGALMLVEGGGPLFNKELLVLTIFNFGLCN